MRFILLDIPKYDNHLVSFVLFSLSLIIALSDGQLKTGTTFWREIADMDYL